MITMREQIEKILQLSAYYMDTDPEYMCSSSRQHNDVLARTIATTVLRDRFNLSWNHIGEIINRDPSSVSRLYEVYANDKEVQSYVSDIMHTIQIRRNYEYHKVAV